MNNTSENCYRNKILIPKIKGQTLVEIEFGVLSKKCKNFGICKITPRTSTGELHTLHDRKGVAILSVYDERYVELLILKCSLSEYTYKEFFQRDTFIIKEHFEYPSKTNTQLTFQVSAGKYRMKEFNSHIQIILKNPN